MTRHTKWPLTRGFVYERCFCAHTRCIYFGNFNSGDSQIKITKIYTSCMCTEATLINETSRKGPFGMPGRGGPSSQIDEVVNPGKEINIDVLVDPAAHGPQGTGPAKKIVYIETDSAINPVLKLELDINVTP